MVRGAKFASFRALPRWVRITVPIVLVLVVLAVAAAWALTVQSLPAGAPPASDYLKADQQSWLLADPTSP